MHLEKSGPTLWQMNLTAQLQELTVGKGNPEFLRCGGRCPSQKVISLFLLAAVIIKSVHITTKNSNLLGQKHRYHHSAASAPST